MPWHDVEILSPRLAIRPFAAGDADEAFPCITPTLTRYLSFEPPASPADFERIWRGWLRTIDAGADFAFSIRLRNDSAFIGLVGLHRTADELPELGIWVREDAHGHAYGLEAVGAVAAWAATRFARSGFLYPVADANLASRRIAGRLGGTVIGQRRAAKYDSVVYRITAPT